jgi:alkylated DNA repair dioxygenase AlkB
MDSLFPVEPIFPEGFLYIPDFLDEKEEQFLIKEISKIKLHNFIFQGFEARRKVASFGYDFNFENRSISPGNPIPTSFEGMIRKVSQTINLEPKDFSELLITEYPVGSVINWHRDAPPFEIIAGISILSDCIFRFRPHEKAKQGRSSIISFPIKRRSLYIIQDTARTEWQHSISAVKDVRYSITLRTLKKSYR